MTIERVMHEVNKLGNTYISITGGEPLLQVELEPLVYELLSFSYIVTIETSGLVPIESCEYNRTYTYCMDIKCPCSGEQDKNCFENLKRLKDKDEVKCVIRDSKDIEYVKNILKKYPTKAQIILSPMDNDLEVCNLILNALKSKKIKGRLGVQLHKILNIK
jgi:7-carboxy-7-deazaguanine synthase